MSLLTKSIADQAHRLIWLAAGLSLASAFTPLFGQTVFTTDFEAPDYTAGTLLSDPVWNFDSLNLDVQINGNDYVSGQQSLNLTGAFPFDYNSDPLLTLPSVLWLDFQLKPIFAEETDLPLSFSADRTAVTGFVKVNAEGEVYAVNGDGQGSGEWLATGSTAALSGDQSQEWIRLTYRLDYVSKTWDLYIGGEMIAADLGFLNPEATRFEQFTLRGDEALASGLDSFTVREDNPFYTDADNDGIDDAYEAAHGLSTSINDRDQDIDFDTLSNLAEYLAGSSANQADTDGDGVHDGAELAAHADPTVADAYNLNALPFSETFEAAALGSIDSVNLWAVESGSATVQSAEVASGSQAVEIAATTEAAVLSNNFDGSAYSQVWVDFQIKPVFWRTGDGPDASEFLYAPLGVFYFNENDQVIYLDGDGQGGGTWETVAVTLDSAQWQRVTLYNDYTAQTWSLWLNGVRVAQDIGFVHPQPYFNHLTIQQGSESAAYMDEITAGDSEPAALDNEGDLLLNSEEIALGTDTELVDTDLDGLADSIEVEIGTNPLVEDADVAQLTAGSSGSTYATSFSSSEGYSSGTLDGQLGWNSTADVGIHSSEFVELSPTGGASANFDRLVGVGDNRKIWVSFKAKLIPGYNTPVPTGSDQSALLFTFVSENTLSVWNPDTLSWDQFITSANANDENHFASYLDYEQKTWSLWINGQEVFAEQPLAADSGYTISKLQVSQENTTGSGSLDELVVTTDSEQARFFSRHRPYLHFGRLDEAGSEWTTVSLPRIYQNPVVVATPVYDRAVQLPAIVRVKGAVPGASQLEFKVQNPSDVSLSGYSIEYVIVEAGVYTQAIHGIDMEADSLEVARVDKKSSWVGNEIDLHTSIANPVVVGQVMTANDPDWSVFWSNGGNHKIAPGSRIFVGRHVGEDSDVTRSEETLGYIVVDSGSVLLEGREFYAALSPDKVTDSPRTYGSFAGISSTLGAVAALSGMDGRDGGFAQFEEPNGITAASVRLSVDEDQLGDAERRHTTEQVGYFIFGAANSASSDGDSLPDWWEQWLADIDPFDSVETIADVTATLDSDGDGVSDYQEDFIQGTDFKNPYDNDPLSAGLVYVDSEIGDNAYSGRAPILYNSYDGPKETLDAGLSVARTEESLIIKSGTYELSTLNLNGKNLTLRLNGPVTLQ